MSKNGVWQCQKLIFSFCRANQSSAGVRALVAGPAFDRFAYENPQLELVKRFRPSKHPEIRAFYVNGAEKVLNVGNAPPEQVLEAAQFLRDQHGEPRSFSKTRQRTARRSIQGPWTPEFEAFPPISD